MQVAAVDAAYRAAAQRIYSAYAGPGHSATYHMYVCDVEHASNAASDYLPATRRGLPGRGFKLLISVDPTRALFASRLEGIGVEACLRRGIWGMPVCRTRCDSVRGAYCS